MVPFTKDLLHNQIEEFGWEIGDFSYGAPIVQTWGNDGHLKIGKYCSFGGNVTIFLGGEHRTDWVTTYPFSVLHESAFHIAGHPHSRGDVIIGNDVWLGQACQILSGVKIGDGACLAASSLIAKDVPPYSIVGGNPAKVLKYRFSEAQIDALIDLAWWNWSEEKLSQHFDKMLSNDIDGFIQAAKSAG